MDRHCRFLDIVVEMKGSTHDSRVLHRSSIYQQAIAGYFFPENVSFEGYRPYLIGDSGYPLLSWLLLPYCNGLGQLD